ncbi:MAG: short chain dehydrogenase [Robiginitomaculum sp.]|nr:MAG: short chain dehydrogenase [Robiginitomaculum sp.]
MTQSVTKSVLITGAGNRIGRALAKGLHADGWAVAIHYNRSKNAAKELANALGARAVTVQANLNIPNEVDTLVSRTIEALGTPLTALINNASTFTPDKAQDFTPALYDHHMDVNLKAPLLLSQHFANALPHDKQGVIINMIDQRVLRPAPDYFSYAISKSALYSATQTLAQALAPRIRVCGIGPGPTLQNSHQNDADFDSEIEATLLGTGSPPDTILHAVRYILSANAVTGQMIAVDGGEHLIF